MTRIVLELKILLQFLFRYGTIEVVKLGEEFEKDVKKIFSSRTDWKEL